MEFHSNNPFDCIIGISHLYIRHKDSRIISQHISILGRFQNTVHQVLDSTCESVYFHLYKIPFFKPVPLYFLLRIFLAIVARICKSIFGTGGVSLAFLLGIVDHSNHHVLLHSSNYFY